MDGEATHANRVSRRWMLGATGVAGVAAAGASGCASDEEEPEPQDALRGTVVAQTGDVPEGSGTILKDAKLILTQPTEDNFKAFTAVCTHAGCTIQEIKKNIHCLCHGSEFDVATGEAVKGPADEPLKEFGITVEGTDITLDEEDQ